MNREAQIVYLAAEGHTDKQIAKELGISPETVATYWKRLLSRHQVRSRTELIARQIRSEAENKLKELVQENQALRSEAHLRKSNESRLESTILRLRAVIDRSPDPVIFESVERQVLLLNRAAIVLFGGLPTDDPQDYVGSDCRAALEKAMPFFSDAKSIVDHIEACVRSEEPSNGFMVPITDGQLFELDHTPLLIGRKVAGHLWVYRNRTELAKSRRAVAETQAIYEGIADLALDPLSDVEELMGAIARRFGADRAYLFQLKQPDRFQCTYEWVERQELAIKKAHYTNFPVREYKWWLDQLASGTPLEVTDMASLPLEACPSSSSSFGDLRAIMLVPISRGGHPIGVFGLDYVFAPVPEGVNRIPALQLAGRLIEKALG